MADGGLGQRSYSSPTAWATTPVKWSPQRESMHNDTVHQARKVSSRTSKKREECKKSMYAWLMEALDVTRCASPLSS